MPCEMRGGFVDLGMLDVATTLANSCGLMTHSTPMESNVIGGMKDNLSDKVVLGTVGNVTEAVAWLGNTCLYVRMRRNPLSHGIDWEALQDDPRLAGRRRTLIVNAARQLDATKMVGFGERSGVPYSSEVGRVASNYYITPSSVKDFSRVPVAAHE